MKLSLPLTGLLCAGMLLTSAASAAELTGTLKRIQHSGTMTLGYREASVPFSYLQADGTPTGYGFEVRQRGREEGTQHAEPDDQVSGRHEREPNSAHPERHG